MSVLKSTSRKWLIIPALALTVATGTMVYSTHTALAAEGNMNRRDYMTSKFASHFGLDETEVSNFFESNRAERQAERAAEHETKLDEAVAAGVITEAQKELLITKQSENMNERQSEREDGERPDREEMESHQDEMKSWAEENGINLDALHEFMGNGMGNHQGPRGRGMHR